jgi:tetratricopeptide (TPR) repeat protein
MANDRTGPDRRRVTYEGKNYIWSGTGWYEDRTFLVPADQVVRKLNQLLEHDLAADDLQVEDTDEALRRARLAQNSLQLDRAERLARRALELDGSHAGAASILCSVLRAKGHPEQALEATEELRRTGYLPLLTSRAAALCDLERWEKAKREIARVLAAGGGGEAFAVVHRIKAARPDLYRGRTR